MQLNDGHGTKSSENSMYVCPDTPLKVCPETSPGGFTKTSLEGSFIKPLGVSRNGFTLVLETPQRFFYF